MKKLFSLHWNSSKQPRKQRKYRVNSPIHIQRKFLAAPLTKELRKKYGRRSVKLRKGDKVKILVGQFKKKEGKIVGLNRKTSKVHIENIQLAKKDGSKAFYPIHASNLLVVELTLDDKQRRKTLERKNGTSQTSTSA